MMAKGNQHVITDIEQGIGLTDEELKELVNMYYSGKYYMKEIAEWFGISNAKLRTYLRLAAERGIEARAKVDWHRKNRWRANESQIR